MKKLVLSFMFLVSALVLTSCKVNWFGQTYDAPWYIILVSTIIPAFVVIVAVYFFIINATYICPECKTEFKPKWNHFYVTIHFDDERVAKCPKCGRKGFCKKKK